MSAYIKLYLARNLTGGRKNGVNGLSFSYCACSFAGLQILVPPVNPVSFPNPILYRRHYTCNKKNPILIPKPNNISDSLISLQIQIMQFNILTTNTVPKMSFALFPNKLIIFSYLLYAGQVTYPSDIRLTCIAQQYQVEPDVIRVYLHSLIF